MGNVTTIGCYYGDYSLCDNTIPMSLFIWNKLFSLTLYKRRIRKLFLYRHNSVMLVVIDLVLVLFSSKSS